MMTEIDDRRGLVKTYWKRVRHRVALVEPNFARLVDELDPDINYPLYLAYYPYGAIDADTVSTLLPRMNGDYYRVTDNNVPEDVVNDLGYSANNTPFGMVLEKQIESFIDLKSLGISIPWLIYGPGRMFPFTRILRAKNNRIYSPNGLLSSSAGARSVFMLPNIGCVTNHSNLQREFNVRVATPKSLYEHWGVFKEITNYDISQLDWRCCVLYFSKSWIDKILCDRSWVDLNKYLHEVAWHQFEYEVNRINYDIIFSIIQRNRNLKPNPYLTDTAKHLFAIASGSVPGYAPAVDDSALPLSLLQSAYVESYGLKKYIPTIMQPIYFDYERAQSPVYYSLQNPSAHVFSPTSREASSTLFEMRELEYIMSIFSEELSMGDGMCSDTIMGKMAKDVVFGYYHNKQDRHGIVSSTIDIAKIDERFSNYSSKLNGVGLGFASDAPFLRGCISIYSRGVIS